MIFFCILISGLVLLLAHGIYGRLFNPVTLYTAPFAVSTCLARSGLFGIYPPSDTAVAYVAVGIFAFFCGNVIRINSQGMAIRRVAQVTTLVQDRRSPARHKLFLVIMAIAVLISVPYLIKTLPLLANGSGLKSIKFEYSNVEGSTLFSTTELLVFQWFVIPVFTLAFLVFCYQLAELGINRLALVFSIAGMIIIVCVSGGRNSIFVFLVLATSSLAMSRHMKSMWRRLVALPRAVKVMAFIGIVALCYITQKRSLAQGAGVVENVFYYFAGPITYFSGILDNPSSFGLGGQLFYGGSLLGFITNPIEVAGAILSGGSVQGTENIISTSVAVFQGFSDHVSGNALSTCLYPFMRDFGDVGVFVGPLLYGAISAFVWRKWLWSLSEGNSMHRERWFMITAYLAYCLVFSFWRYVPLFTSTGVILVLVLVVTAQPRMNGGKMGTGQASGGVACFFNGRQVRRRPANVSAGPRFFLHSRVTTLTGSCGELRSGQSAGRLE